MLASDLDFEPRKVTPRTQDRSWNVREDALDSMIKEYWGAGKNTADMASEWVLPQALVANRLAQLRDMGLL